MKKIFFIITISLLAFVHAKNARACVIAVEGKAELTLLREVYRLKELNLTTQTDQASIGIKIVASEVTSSKVDPVFGTVKIAKTPKLRADIYELGQVIASTEFYPAWDFSEGANAPFAQDLKRTIQAINCK